MSVSVPSVSVHREPSRLDALREWPSQALVPALKLSSQTLLGIIATPYSILVSWDLREKYCINKLAQLTGESRKIFPLLLLHTGKIFNPKFNYSRTHPDALYASVTNKTLRPLEQKIHDYVQEEKYLRAKLVALISIPVAIVARVADFALGVFLILPTQLYWLGSHPQVNSHTYQLLNLPALIDDVFHGVRGVFISEAEYRVVVAPDFLRYTPYSHYLMPITNRVTALLELPVIVLGCALGVHTVAIGILGVAYSILTLGRNETINSSASLTAPAREILPELLGAAAKIFNPHFSYDEEEIKASEVRDQTDEATFSTQFTGALLERLKKCTQSNNFFEREITSRTVSLVIIPVAVAARVADLALGLFVVLPTQLYYLGTDESVNTATLKLLNVLALVDDLAFGVRGLFTPNAIWKWAAWQRQSESLARHLSAFEEAQQEFYEGHELMYPS